MKAMVIIIWLLAIGLFTPIGQSSASEYVFGTKVAAFDSDAGRLLKNIPQGSVLGFWDIGSDPGSYDADDVVYLDLPPTGIANANDIRLTSFALLPAGSKVKSIDNDVNSPLIFMPMEISFLNLYGSRSYDFSDPVYAHQSSPVRLRSFIDSDTNSDAVRSREYASTTAADWRNLVVSPEYPEISQGYAASSQQQAISERGFRILEGPLGYISGTGPIEGFSERLSYSGSCGDLPLGGICLQYSDNFRLVVSDYRMDRLPVVVGYSDTRPIEMIRCYEADYYHVLGTRLVKIDAKQKALIPVASGMISPPNPATIKRAQSQSMPIAGYDPKETYRAAAPGPVGSSKVKMKDINEIVDAVNAVSASTDSTRTYDIRLISLGELAAGTKVMDFDPDQNKLVALPVLASFPSQPDDYGAIRFYDANGNGLYDFQDDVYLDISFDGSSPSGMVSVNGVRISGPAI